MSDKFARISLEFLSHPKVIRATRTAGGDAVWMWLGVLLWQRRHDGMPVPDDCTDAVEGPKNTRTRAVALRSLVDAGLLEHGPDGYAVHDYDHWSDDRDANVIRAYEKTRKKAQRQRRNVPDSSGTVPDTVPDVPGHSSRARAQELEEEGEKEEEGEEEREREREHTPTPPAPPTFDGIRDDDHETPCPLDLAERWTGAPSMAEALKVPRAAVDAVVEEFVTYWTIGGGVGKRRSQWARKLRDEVRRKAPLEAQKLAAAATAGQAGPPARASPDEQARLNAICDAADADARRILLERSGGGTA